MKTWLPLLAALALSLIAPDADAQGRCRCNSGCHNYPGQCVSGSGTCDQGYAPFCGTRAAADCRTGWVSCSGECTCVRIPGYDGGVAPDASTPDVPPPLDAPRTDAPPGADAPRADAPPGTDAPRVDAPPGADAPPGVDVPRADVPPGLDAAPPPDLPVGADAPPGTDAPPGLDAATGDAPPAVGDASVPIDAPCECDGGICYFGQCVRDRCEYQRELGFVCALEGRRCVLLEGEAWCVPGCLGVACTAAEFCEPETGNCLRDMCSTLRCPLGSRCAMNRCLAADGGVVDAGAAGDGGAPPTAVDDGGCGCRARPTSGGGWAMLAALALLGARRRRAR